jgi:DNA repair exonuclease SbcCD ATPase subunit
MTRIAVTLAACAACAALACAGSRPEQKPVTVSDSDYGRLESGQTQLVDAARVELGRARDEFARAKLGETDAKQEDELARADLKAAEGARMRADSLAKTAKESNAPADIEAARTMAETARLHLQVADAHMAYAKAVQAQRAAEVRTAERRVAYESARVELAKLQALQQAAVPAAAKYPAAQLEGQVAQARRQLEQAEKESGGGEAQVMSARRTWEELNRRLQAKLGQPPRS